MHDEATRTKLRRAAVAAKVSSAVKKLDPKDVDYCNMLMQKSVENQHEVWLALAAQLEVDEKSAEEYIKQQYPIDMSQIDCTDPEGKTS